MKHHESVFCPVTCTLAELDNAIKAASDKERRGFLEGVRHARIIIAAATGISTT